MVHFQNICVTFEFQGHWISIKVTAVKKRPRAGMCSPQAQLNSAYVYSSKDKFGLKVHSGLHQANDVQTTATNDRSVCQLSVT